MNNKQKWTLGTGLAVILLALLVLTVQGFFPNGVYHMMNGYGWPMPMMYGGGMMGFGMVFLMWLIMFGLLILIGLGIVWLVRTLTVTK